MFSELLSTTISKNANRFLINLSSGSFTCAVHLNLCYHALETYITLKNVLKNALYSSKRYKYTLFPMNTFLLMLSSINHLLDLSFTELIALPDQLFGHNYYSLDLLHILVPKNTFLWKLSKHKTLRLFFVL